MSVGILKLRWTYCWRQKSKWREVYNERKSQAGNRTETSRDLTLDSASLARIVIEDMLKRLAAFLILLAFAGQALAGGIVCSVDAIANGLNQIDEAVCSMQGMGECDNMACCTQGKSPTGSIVAMICCEVKCGESTGGAKFNFTPQSLVPATLIVTIRLVSLDALGEVKASAAAVSVRSAGDRLLHHNSPDLFLSNSTFLI